MEFSEFNAVARSVVADLCPTGFVTVHENGLLYDERDETVPNTWTMHVYPDGEPKTDNEPRLSMAIEAGAACEAPAGPDMKSVLREQLFQSRARALEKRAAKASAQ